MVAMTLAQYVLPLEPNPFEMLYLERMFGNKKYDNQNNIFLIQNMYVGLQFTHMNLHTSIVSLSQIINGCTQKPQVVLNYTVNQHIII
jgi:hypothetical protein